MNEDIYNIRLVNACLKYCFDGNVTNMAKTLHISRRQINNWRSGRTKIKLLVVNECKRRLQYKRKMHLVEKTPLTLPRGKERRANPDAEK